ncbi:hypothetical protein [Brevibacillus dissolubilis]|uniref:hypothetical protein n=1 Tax=Brevibacillus dissolubilis TaxID=1844116 RepID=UPI001116A5AB|nr:hypothetical protein [Brevibacillus dissolubilis]
MKNARTYPFERNHYFYGKLLTVRDFETEQKYVNDKRRLINRLLYGSGVVAGLAVIKVDDKSVSIEMGVALDSMGREIVVPSPRTVKLSTLEGFSNNEYDKNVYLCIAYDETEKEPVHSVAVTAVRQDEVKEYNRIGESYRLFVREEAPAPETFPLTHLVEDTCLLYQDNRVRITQKAPRYVNPGELFDVTLVIEKTVDTPKIKLDFEAESDLFQTEDGKKTKPVAYTEPYYIEETHYEIRYQLQAPDVTDTKGTISIREGSVQLIIGDKQADFLADAELTVQVINGSVQERLIRDYFDRSLDASLEATPDACIHLAKISLSKIGSNTFRIHAVEPVPFDEYVHPYSLLHRLGSIGTNGQSGHAIMPAFAAKSTTKFHETSQPPQLQVEFNQTKQEFDFQLSVPRANSHAPQIATGVISIDLEPGHKSGVNFFNKWSKSFFSDEISHGLGEGRLLITTGVIDIRTHAMVDMRNSGERIYFGDHGVFDEFDSETEIPTVPELSVGTVLFPKKGAFRIGVKAQQLEQPVTLLIQWWAVKQSAEYGWG